jgi:long-chain acyl-CoA synthetase
MHTVAEALCRQAAGRPTQVAIVAADQSSSLTYGELWERSLAVADYFRAHGVQRGDRVLLSAESAPEFAAAYFGTHLCGAIAVPTDSTMPEPKLRALAARIEPKVVVGNAAALAACATARAGLALEGLRGLRAATQHQDTLPAERDTADLLFTSGTTGRAKGVVLTQRNLAAAAGHINQVIGNGGDDREVVPLPLNHSFGLMRLRCNVLVGGTLVLCRGFRMPGEIFAALDAHAATGLVGVPAGFSLLLRFGQDGLGKLADRLRYIEIGSAAMPISHKQALMDLLPRTRLFMHYGLTEASRSAFIEFQRDRAKLDTIGKPSPGVQMSMRDEQGREVAAGEPGMLWISGDSVSHGYWDDPELTSRMFSDGWVCSGDLASLDADGFVRLHGRRDDMINAGGYNVAPDEVERALCEHPTIEDAACVAMADPRGISGQVIRAFVVLRKGQRAPTPRELSNWLGERLEHYRIPARYDWITAIPRTASGKIQRATLRSQENEASPKPEPS